LTCQLYLYFTIENASAELTSCYPTIYESNFQSSFKKILFYKLLFYLKLTINIARPSVCPNERKYLRAGKTLEHLIWY